MVSTLLAAAAATVLLSSPDFSAGGVIPRALMAADCGGQNTTPRLRWTGVPSTARSFALIEYDPDAPVPGGFYHWVVYDLPQSTRSLGTSLPPGSREGVRSSGKPGYYGPCPPPGQTHHYVFTLYAVDVAQIGGDTPLNGPQLETRMRGHILARATLVATASHS
jgi:Raf kinase inhibitor-like YbhB/YbcL family protein